MHTPTVQSWVELTAPISDALDQVISVFDAEIASDLPFVNELCDQVRTYRGKLLRPRLLLLAGQACGGIKREHITLAAVVEMVHMATLVHDDVLDEADVRRRKPTVNRMAGNESAVMLGDYLISHAYHLCSSLSSTAASRRIAAVTNTICEGELMQIHSRGDLELDQSRYMEIIRRKTASLTSLCCELGAQFAGGNREVIVRMSKYGENLGMSFQIVDDLLDLTASESEMGKSVGRDAEMGKLTLPLIRFMEAADEADARRMKALLRGSPSTHKAEIGALLTGSGAIEATMNVARKYVDTAIAEISALPANSAQESLIAAANLILHRRN